MKFFGKRNTFRHLAIAKKLDYRVLVLPSEEKNIVPQKNDVYETHVDINLLLGSIDKKGLTE